MLKHQVARRNALRQLAGWLVMLCGLFSRGAAAQQPWPRSSFAASSVDAVLEELFGTSDYQSSSLINIVFPESIPDDAAVPIEVSSDLRAVESITIVVGGHPQPLNSRYEFGPTAVPYVSTRVKFPPSGQLLVLVQAAGQLYATHKLINPPAA